MFLPLGLKGPFLQSVWFFYPATEGLKVFSEFLLYFYMYYLPLGKGVVLNMYNSESPLSKDALCQVWLKIGPAVLKKKSKM
jgi:hypothetical protein